MREPSARESGNALKGRLAEVYVPALVAGTLDALSRRLGNRATVDDPIFGRASTLSSLDPMLGKIAARFREQRATYRHVATSMGVDRDVAEGVLTITVDGRLRELPIAVVAERRRLREIELRVYYATLEADRRVRLPLTAERADVAVPQIVAHVLDALGKGAIERILAAFEEGSRWVDPLGVTYPKRDGSIASFLSNLRGRLDVSTSGAADDGRTCSIEATVSRPSKPSVAPETIALSFERGDTGLLRELRLYYEP